MFIDELKKFNTLSKCLIDASSIIYMKKSDFFDILSEKIKLLTIKEIITETGYNDLNLHIIEHRITSVSNDNKLIQIMKSKKLTIISDDKRIIQQGRENNLTYYNSLMMLIFLLYKKHISYSEYIKFNKKLTNIAWYSKKIITYANTLVNTIIETV